MAKLNPGDIIQCRIKGDEIVFPYDTDYDIVRVFEIISKDEWGYLLYIPHYLYLKNCVILDKVKIKDWKINNKFADEKSLYIRESLVYKVESLSDGCCCSKCGEFYSKASPNQEDGISMICWNCRMYHYY